MKNGELEVAEAALLGACLLNAKAPIIASEYVDRSDFFYPKHQLIWDAMTAIVVRGENPDPVSVSSELGSGVDRAGGSSYIFSLPSLCPAATNVRQYAKAVAESATDRRVRHAVTDSLQGQEGNELLSVLQEKLYHLDRRVTQAKTMADVWQQIRKYGTEPVAPGCEYPWNQIQLWTRGIRPGWLCIVAGEASHGKTAAALEITERALKNQKRVVFLSLEMGAEEIGLRLAQRKGLSADRYYWGRLNDTDAALLGEIELYQYWDNLVLDRVERAAQIALLIRRWKPDLVVVDHLQLLAGSEKVEELSRTTRTLKLTAERFETPILCLSQLSRAAHEERNRKPRLSRLRGSGTIEQDADTVVFVHRERDENEELTSEATLTVAKSRMGKLGSIRARFLGDTQTFVPVTHVYEDPF